MAKLLLPRRAVETLIKLDDAGRDKLALFGTPVEQLTASEIELEISANRPDLLSLPGFIRALRSFLGKGQTEYNPKKAQPTHRVIVEKEVKPVRPFTTCAIIKGLQLNDERVKQIILLQEKMHSSIGRNRKRVAIGIYPLDKIAFPITYTARMPKEIIFQPLGAPKPMTAMHILEKHPTGKEYGNLLHKETKYPIFIDAKGTILSMPPIINNEEIGRVTTDTRDLFIECSGHNKYFLDKTLAILVTALADLGGTIHEVTVEDGKKETTPNLKWEEVSFKSSDCTAVLGYELKETEIARCLEKMGHHYKKNKVHVAPWRTDILHPIDLVEDIIIAHGYDNLVPTFSTASTTAEEDPLERMKGVVMELLIGYGASQIMTPHLITTEEAKRMKVTHAIEVESSKSEFTLLRPNLLIPMLRTLTHNTDAEYPQKLFECGRVFQRDDAEECGIREEEWLSVALSPGNATEAKQVLEYILRMLNRTCSFKDKKEEGFIEGRTVAAYIDKTEIGYIGEAHPTMLREWHIKMPLSIVMVNITRLFNLS